MSSPRIKAEQNPAEKDEGQSSFWTATESRAECEYPYIHTTSLSNQLRINLATKPSGAQATTDVPVEDKSKCPHYSTCPFFCLNALHTRYLGTSSKRKRGSRPVNLSNQAAKKSKPAAVSQTSRDIAVVSNFITERDNEISALKAELNAQKAAAASEKDKLKKKLDQAKYMQSKYELAIKMLAKNKVELARKDDELAQLRSKLEGVRSLLR